MYSLDINFLNDREGYSAASSGYPRARAPIGSQTPLIAGVAVGVLLPLIAGATWFYFQNRATALETQQQELQAQLASLEAAKKEADQFNAQADQIKTEVDGLVAVFNQIKPSSAVLQDVSDRVPVGVQIDSFAEVDGRITLTGTARSYNDVNDFLLVLQRSPFLKATATQLKGARLVAYPTPVELLGAQQATPSGSGQTRGTPGVTIKTPQVVSYTIETNLNDVPASQLLQELESKGAGGLVTRIRTLQEKGVI